LTNEQIEQDLHVKGKELHQGHYHGSQDTGDNKIRSAGKGKEKTNDEGEKEDGK
jgi:hypothetical protein